MGGADRGTAARVKPAGRGEPVLWLLMAAFIAYGSLYPFRFHLAGGNLAHLMGTWRHWDHPSDLLSNILLYMPFGFLGARTLPHRFGGALVLASGVLLSAAMELTQFYDQGRDSTLGDVYANAIGTAAGVTIASILGVGQRWALLRALQTDEPGSVVLAAWFAYRLYPYVPTIDWHKYAHALAALVTGPWPDLQDSARFLIAWLLVAALTKALWGPGRARFVFVLLAGTEFVGRVLIIDTAPSLKDLAGAAGAFLVWRLVPSGPGNRLRLLAVAMALLVLAERLAPFQFAPHPLRTFGWVPGLSLMVGSIDVAMQALCEKLFTYGGLIWLGWRGGLMLGPATIGAAVLLAVTSYAQVWLPDRSAEVTDAVLALIIGGVFMLLERPAGLHSRGIGAASLCPQALKSLKAPISRPEGRD